MLRLAGLRIMYEMAIRGFKVEPTLSDESKRQLVVRRRNKREANVNIPAREGAKRLVRPGGHTQSWGCLLGWI